MRRFLSRLYIRCSIALAVLWVASVALLPVSATLYFLNNL